MSKNMPECYNPLIGVRWPSDPLIKPYGGFIVWNYHTVEWDYMDIKSFENLKEVYEKEVRINI